ncbi:MAG TPA: ABC transporter permease [Bacilli bacterium]|nr:MAG: Branched-chain amino acid transport system / permease component [Tenericutes bacterium ADurb.BinA124]HPN60859.1 ABC transporter permease [Bacilli bacterium]HPX84314.1 ABC transporter permease [Bacilli bacterium]HQC74600.1 ABC transporter permease [Bacilli bacterium]
MDNLSFFVQQMLIFFVPLVIVAIGGMFSEKSGVINIALEGIMIFGGYVGIVFIRAMQQKGYLADSPQLLLICGLIISGVSGLIFSLLHAFASINLKADQTISGVALNMLAPALVFFIARSATNTRQVFFNPVFMIRSVPWLGKIPILGPLFFQKAYLTTYIGIAIVLLSAFILRKTRLGLRLSACGEHPQAAESVGVNVQKMRWLGVGISGFLAGIGGLSFTIACAVSFNGTVAGYGFLALAVMIFGQWKPIRILWAALFFAVFKALSTTYSIFPFLVAWDIPNKGYIFNILPFVATMVALAFTSKKSRAPKAEGIPFDSGAR